MAAAAFGCCGSGALKEGHQVGSIFFFAGRPNSRTTRLMIDNVRLEGSEE